MINIVQLLNRPNSLVLSLFDVYTTSYFLSDAFVLEEHADVRREAEEAGGGDELE